MTGSRVYLCALSSDVWNPSTGSAGLFARLVNDALSIERRIIKDVNIDVERTRYNLACGQIESFASGLPWTSAEPGGLTLRPEAAAVAVLDGTYLGVIRDILAREPERSRKIRLGASFFTPDSVEAHLDGFSELSTQQLHNYSDDSTQAAINSRLGFFSEVAQQRGGVVEVQSHFLPGSRVVERISGSPPPERLPDFGVEELYENEGQEVTVVLDNQVKAAIETRSAVNFTGIPHRAITDVLHRHVYSESGSTPTSIRVVYSDGSEGSPFPVRCLQPRQGDLLTRLRPLRVALISMRHLQLDSEADMAWFRNREASKSRTLGEADDFCYRRSVEQFRNSRAEDDLLIHLLQTGFQPAILGFYRALVEELLERDGEPGLAVVPRYYNRAGQPRSDGNPWT